MPDLRNTASRRPNGSTLAAPQTMPLPQCSCGGYVRKTRDAVYQDVFYQCINCGREYSQIPVADVTTPTPDQATSPTDSPAVPHFSLAPPHPLEEPPHPQQLLTAMRWPRGVKCPNCRSSNIRTISPPPQLGFACDSCNRYFDHRTKTLLERYRVPDASWIDLINRTAELREAPDKIDIAPITLLNPDQAERLHHDLIRAIAHLDSEHSESQEEFCRRLIESYSANTEDGPTTVGINLNQPALPFMAQNRAPAQILASLRWPQGIPCTSCNQHDFRYNGPPTHGEYVCQHCDHSVNLRDRNIMANTNHALRTWLTALRVLFASQDTMEPDQLQELADIAPFPAQSITERFQKILPIWGHSPSTTITVGRDQRIPQHPVTITPWQRFPPATPNISYIRHYAGNWRTLADDQRQHHRTPRYASIRGQTTRHN